MERQHRTMLSQVLNKNGFRGWSGLYEECEERRQRLNSDIPCASLNEKAPLEVFPGHYHSGRFYRPEAENQLFDMKLVHRFLAQGSWTRKVSKNGTVKIAKNSYSIPKANIGQKVNINFGPRTRGVPFQR